MAGTNVAQTFQSDVVTFIAEKTLPLARKQLVAYQFGDPLTLPKGRGTTYTATRYLRIPLPNAPISEGVPPIGESMSINQVSVVAQQWGDKVTITDVAEMTIYHPLFQKATELVGLQVGETLERNTFLTLMSGSQINYVNFKGARGLLTAGDVLNPFEIQRAYSMLFNLGAPRFNGDEMTNTRLEADAGGARASNNPRQMPHYTALIHPFVAADLRQDAKVQQAWSYSDINRIYNYEAGEFNGIRFCETNMLPSWTGNTAATAVTASATGGSLTNGGTYYAQVTATDLNNQFESVIYPITTVSVTAGGTGTSGSFTIALPASTNFTYTVYISSSSTMANAAVASSASGPTTGPMTGLATQLAGGTTPVITGPTTPGNVSGTGPGRSSFGLNSTAQPPASPANGITVYPTFIIGRGAYGQVMLDEVKFTYLKEADKSDPLNQLRVVGWKAFYGTLIQNQNFLMRIESVSAFNATFG
jgi:N4-gp56 family major capsid protein